MKNTNKFAIFIAVITFLFSVLFYELYVKAWSANEKAAIIRLDIFIIYPIILIFAIAVFFIFKKAKTIKNKLIFTSLFLLFWIVFAGIFKFNILSNMKGYDVDGNLIKQEKTISKIKEKLIGSWLDTSERKLHFTLFKDGTAHSDNMKTLLYKKWRLKNNKLIITAESIGNGSNSTDDEVYEIVVLTNEELILKKGELTERYIKKK